MTYQDPDPLRDRNLDPNRNPNLDPTLERDYGSNAMWGWIAGAVVLVLLLVFMCGGSNETNTASNQPRTNAPLVNPPPANNVANAPRGNTAPPASSETTGQSTPSPSAPNTTQQ